MGFFELQILEIENYRGQLATGECCGGGGIPFAHQLPGSPPSSLQCTGAPQCNTLFRVCLREYQSRQPTSATAMATGGRMDDEPTAAAASNHHHHHHQTTVSNLHHCSFGNVTSPVLGGNSFTLGNDAAAAAEPSSPDSGNRGAAAGNLALPFSFSWTVSTLLLCPYTHNRTDVG